MDKLKKDNDTLKEELALETKQAMASNSSAAAGALRPAPIGGSSNQPLPSAASTSTDASASPLSSS